MKAASVHIHKIVAPVNLLTLPENHWQAIKTDWNGTPLPFDWQFYLAYDDKLFHFFTRSSAPIELPPYAEANSFTPELWKYTVAELFLFRKSGSKYQEYNIAPNGAWWHATFSNYRLQEPGNPPEFQKLVPLAFKHTTRWIAGFSMPLQNIAHPLDLSDVLINVCGIAGHHTQTFIAYNPLPERQADFHLKELGGTVKIVE